MILQGVTFMIEDKLLYEFDEYATDSRYTASENLYPDLDMGKLSEYIKKNNLRWKDLTEEKIIEILNIRGKNNNV